MSSQNINQYPLKNWSIILDLDSYDMSLTSDEQDYNQEVVFSPYLIAQTYGNRLPISFDINNPDSAQPLNLYYKIYNSNNIFVSQNYYNPNNEDLSCFTASSSCDIGLTGTDNGLVPNMSGETINFTNGLFDGSLKFNRLYFDRRLKLFQVTSYADYPNFKFSGFPLDVLYEVVSKDNIFIGKYHELYGGFYQGFYKLFGYDYDILPDRVNKGWSVEMIIKPRLINEYSPGPGETTLNMVYPENKNIFFYWGTRAENKYYHHADGTPNCFTGYTRVTSDLTGLTTCSCCNQTITNSRCIFIYPPRSKNGKHDSHVNYGCNKCNGKKDISLTCGCGCYDQTCETCGWECQTHECSSVIPPTPTPTPSPTPIPDNCIPTPVCTPSCTTCDKCNECVDCRYTGFSSVEDTCEKDPLWDSLSNAISFKLCGDIRNPKIGVKVLRFTGGCETTGTCSNSGITYETGYTITELCSPTPIYPECENINPAFLDVEHWFQFNAVWERYSWFDDCDLLYRGGLGDITKKVYLESLANNTTALVRPPYTNNQQIAEQIELVNLNEKWLLNKEYRRGRLKIYINGKLFWTIEDFEEVIPRALNTDKERQVGVPFNISWGGGTQGLRENLVFKSCTIWEYEVGSATTNINYYNCYNDYVTISNVENSKNTIYVYKGTTPEFTIEDENNSLVLIDGNYIPPFGPYQQDPECFPTNDLTNTSYNGLKTNILLEQNFAGTFEGAISQFRLYVTPLSSPEIKHNFNISKGQFRMFNPDCPDCSTTECSTNDFTYTIIDESLLVDLLGRKYSLDVRDQKYLIENKLTTKVTNLKTRYWENVWWGNQGNTPQCVGYAWAHWIDDGPIKHNGHKPNVNPTLIYRESQKIDEWPGEQYDGTSVRAGAKYLKNIGKINSYLWTYNINTLINTVLNVGPVVVGTNWYYNMFFPDRKTGIIKPTGRLAGGHAYMINGIDINKKLFRIKNSWGQKWGVSGHAYISFSDMERLIKQNGEVCLAIEKKF
jgi:hypothetical protein